MKANNYNELTVSIPEITITDAGEYVCVAENSHGHSYCRTTVRVQSKGVVFCPIVYVLTIFRTLNTSSLTIIYANFFK